MEKNHRELDTGGRDVKIGCVLGLERFQVSPNGKSRMKLVADLVQRNQVHGVIGMGGTQGTTLATKVMRALPYGLPKVTVGAALFNLFGGRLIMRDSRHGKVPRKFATPSSLISKNCPFNALNPYFLYLLHPFTFPHSKTRPGNQLASTPATGLECPSAGTILHPK